MAAVPTWGHLARPRDPHPSSSLTGSLAALDVTLDNDFEDRLDELFPGSGGEAPDAYTWS